MARQCFSFLIAACLAGAVSLAESQDDRYMRIVRLSYMEGPVSFQHRSDVDWSAASVNLPLEPGDRIYTGAGGRAEIQFDDGSAFRLAENTDVEFLSLDEDLIQIRMLLGLSSLTVSGDADFEINTPAAAFNAVREGVYRFDVVENGDTDAIVRKGELEAANNEFSRRIKSGELVHINAKGRGTPETSLYDRRDEWDEWTDRRNADLRVYGNVRYLPDNVYVGAADLDRYGRWVSVESYGNAWVPYYVDDFWSPYSVGRWCYRPFFGWTWISYEPWGWLPYHYGSWYRSSFYGWCWLPGPGFSFNFWSPGLVSFYSGPGWVSWCPLGPGDYYNVSHYHYNRGIYSRQLADLQHLHSRPPGDPFNRDVQGAFRTAHLDQFRNGAFDGRNSSWGNVGRPWSEGSLVQDGLEIQPTSTSFSPAPTRPVVRPATMSSLPAVVRNVPGRNLDNKGGYTRITNPQVSSSSSRGLRSRNQSGSSPNIPEAGARGVTTPASSFGSAPAPQQNRRLTTPKPSVSSPTVNQDRGTSILSGSGSPGGAANARSRRNQPLGSQPATSAPATTPQNSPKRNERSIPEQKQKVVPPSQESAPRSATPQDSRARTLAAPTQPNSGNARSTRSWNSPVFTVPPSHSEASPGSSDYGNSFAAPSATRNNSSAARPGIGRWSESSPAGRRSGSVQVYTWPRSSGGSWGGSSQSGSAPSYSAPPDNSGGWSASSRGSMRSAPSYGAPRQSGSSYSRSGGNSGAGSFSTGRSSPSGNSGGRGRGR